MDQRQVGFPAFVAEHERQLRGTALLLTGAPADADDLLVAALARTHRRWRRLGTPAAALTDARDALIAGTLDRTRLPGAGRDSALVAGPEEDPDDRWLQALAGLDPRTRAVTVLRLHEDLDEGAVAALLGCSPAEVGSALAHGVEALTPVLADEPADAAGPAGPSGIAAPVADPEPRAEAEPPAVPVHGPHDLPPDDADPYAIYRRPGTPQQRPAQRSAPVPTRPPTPVVAPSHPDDDPNAIYRRPT